MKKVDIIIRPMRLEAVKAALAEEAEVLGLTCTDVRGRGRDDETTASSFRGARYVSTLVPKVRIVMILPDDRVQRVIDIVLTYARTGEVGDGKIFVMPVDDAVRIRTGDRGTIAVA